MTAMDMFTKALKEDNKKMSLRRIAAYQRKPLRKTEEADYSDISQFIDFLGEIGIKSQVYKPTAIKILNNWYFDVI